MSAPEATDCLPCGCLPGADVCPRCTPVGEASVPTATIPRPTPGSVAAELVLLRADHRRQVLDIHTALDKCGAPLGGSPAERIEEWASGVACRLESARLIAMEATVREADRNDLFHRAEAAEAALDSIRDALEVSADMDAADLVAVIEATVRQRKPSPMLPSILALLDMRAKGDEALTHLVALLRGAL